LAVGVGCPVLGAVEAWGGVRVEWCVFVVGLKNVWVKFFG